MRKTHYLPSREHGHGLTTDACPLCEILKLNQDKFIYDEKNGVYYLYEETNNGRTSKINIK